MEKIEEIVEIVEEINNIIKFLYLKSGKTNRTKLIIAGIDGEAINWGDLKCFDVGKLTEDTYVAFIDEASPDAYKFREYISKKMAERGYKVEVRTEW